MFCVGRVLEATVPKPCFFLFVKQKTAYEVRKGDWSSDVCSSDLIPLRLSTLTTLATVGLAAAAAHLMRSEERRVGKECPSLCRSRWSPRPEKKNVDVCAGWQHAFSGRARLLLGLLL